MIVIAISPKFLNLMFIKFSENSGHRFKSREVRGSLLNGQNLLSVMKVICWRSLKEIIAQTLTEIKNE